ncbi:hypothetical protein J2Z37_001907 [Ammoniphilus resinae]|uniref:ANTAR domain-containing protein n=1 Tax=Ammoniphilus resinae TaxID=861532 RepID=A0ABS4GNV2_9BACL|nr:hypothetical protein [Ammoniphilus resinae]
MVDHEAIKYVVNLMLKAGVEQEKILEITRQLSKSIRSSSEQLAKEIIRKYK